MRCGNRILLAACALLLTSCRSGAAPITETAPPTETPPVSEVVMDAELTAQAPAATRPAQQDDTALVVFAAPSFTGAFDEIVAAFEADHPDVRIALSYGSSAQLVQGAAADVFASASEQEMGAAVAARRIALPTVTFASDRLTIIVPASNPAGIEALEGLAAPGLRLALAAPGMPARDTTDQMLEAISADLAYGVSFRAAVYANIVSEEDTARQVVEKVAQGETDAGIVYVSDITSDVADDLQRIELPDTFPVTAAYLIGIVAGAPHPEQARAFVDFVLSDEGQTILARWGFGTAPRD